MARTKKNQTTVSKHLGILPDIIELEILPGFGSKHYLVIVCLVDVSVNCDGL